MASHKHRPVNKYLLIILISIVLAILTWYFFSRRIRQIEDALYKAMQGQAVP